MEAVFLFGLGERLIKNQRVGKEQESATTIVEILRSFAAHDLAMPADYGGWFEDAENTIRLVGGEAASLFWRCSQHGQHPFLLAAGSDGMRLLVGEDVQLLAKDQNFKIFVNAGEASDA